jgi:gas vesicle protein
MGGMDIATLGIRVDANGAITVLDKFGKEVDKVERKTSSLGTTLGHLGRWFGAGLIANKFVQETIAAQDSMAQLEAAVKSTGGAAGLSVRQLDDLSASLQRTTTYSDDAVKGAESLLLTFTKIRGDQFVGATEAVTDLAARMGGDLKGAALQVGKALNDPAQGLTALTRSGVSFTDFQKDVITSLFETGEAAKAQQMILEELRKEFGGSAEAARNTLGGAIKGLTNDFGDLFEVTRADSGQAIETIESLGSVLRTLKENMGEVVAAGRLMAGVFAARWVGGAVQSVTAYIKTLTLQIAASRAAQVAEAERAVQAARTAVVEQAIARERVKNAALDMLSIRERAAALNVLAVANARVAATAAVATQAAAATTLFGRAMAGAAVAGRGLMAVLGGPIGIILTALSAAWYLVSRNTAKAREETEKYRDTYRESLGQMKADQLMSLALAKEVEAAHLRAARLALPTSPTGIVGFGGAKTGNVPIDPHAVERNRLQQRENQLRTESAVLWDQASDAVRTHNKAQQDSVASANKLIAEQQLELDKITALNNAYGQSESALRILGIRKDAQIQKAKNASEYSGKELADLNRLTDAMTREQIRAVRNEETHQYWERQRQLTAQHTDELERQEEAEANLRTTAANKLIEMRIQIDEQDRMTAALRQGQDAVDALTVALAGERAMRAGLAKATNWQREEQARLDKQEAQGAINQRKVIAQAEEAKQAAKEAEREQKQRQKAMLDSWQRNISSFWVDLFNNGIKTFGSLFDRIKQMFAQLIADLIARKMMQKLAGVAASILGISGTAGAQSSGMLSGLGGQMLKEFGGSALGGLGVGYGIGGMTTDRALGGLGGAASGAAVGFAMGGGPVGAAIGGVAGFIGGILGSGKAAKEAARQLRQLRDALEANIATARAQIYGGREGLKASIQQAEADFNKMRDDARKVHKVTWLDQIQYEQKGILSERQKALKEINELEVQRIQQLKEEYEIQQRRLQEDYGVRLLRAQGNTQQAEDLAFLLQQQREYDDLRKQGADDATQAALLQAQSAERAAYAQQKYAAVIQSLVDFSNSLKLDSSLSTLSPMQQMAEAQRQYEEILAKARLGDQSAAGQLPSVARAFLEASRGVYASGAGYASAYDRVQSDTSAITDIFESARDVQTDMLAELKTSVAVSQAGYKQIAQKLDLLATKIDEGTSVTKRGLEGAKLK